MAAKLGLKPGHRLLVVNAPAPAGELLGPLPEGSSLVSAPPADAVVLFVRDMSDLREGIADAAAATPDGGVLWVAYPKGGSGLKTDLNRDVIRIWVEGNTDLRTVSQVAIDPTWSALRLRESNRVGR